MALATLDLHALRRWVVAARADLATYAESINGLNVFPVPDGDTGTNLLLTVDGALGSLTFAQPEDLGAAARDLAQATLMAARGNSGVILSQLARGVAEVLAESPDQVVTAARLAEALGRAANYAWRSVSSPVEGTILTVAGAAADGAALRADGTLLEVIVAAVEAAEVALINTTGQLESLRLADVVDAGGAGYLVVLRSLRRVIEADGALVRPEATMPEWLAVSAPALAAGCSQTDHGGPGYEVMFVLGQSDADRVDRLRVALDRLGESVVVAGGPDVWSVHVHVDDVAAALNAGVAAGRPERFSVTRFADELAARHAVPVSADVRTVVVAVADSPGLVELAEREERMVIPGDAGRLARSSAVRAIRDAKADAVLLVSDGARSSQTADVLERALRDKDIRVLRPGSSGPVEFVAALAVAQPTQDGEQVIAAVDEALVELSTGDLAIADEEFSTTVGRCPKGAVVGRIDGEVIAFGAEALPIAAQVVQTLVAEHAGELVTLITGENAPEALAATLATSLSRTHPGVEVTTLSGRGPYVLAVGVE